MAATGRGRAFKAGAGGRTVFAGDVEASNRGADEAAVAVEQRIGEPGIGSDAALVAVEAGEAVGQEQARGVEVEGDRILVGIVVLALLGGGRHHLDDRRQAPGQTVVGNEGHAQVEAGLGIDITACRRRRSRQRPARSPDM